MKVGDPQPGGPAPAPKGVVNPSPADKAPQGVTPPTSHIPFQELLQAPPPPQADAVAAPHPVTVSRIALEIDPQVVALQAAPPATVEIQFESRVFDRLTITVTRTPPGARTPGSSEVPSKPVEIRLAAATKEAAALLSQAVPQLRLELSKRGHEAAVTVSVAPAGQRPRRGGGR